MNESTNLQDSCEICIIKKNGNVTTTRTNGGNRK
jgi:hypothetical protein